MFINYNVEHSYDKHFIKLDNKKLHKHRNLRMCKHN